MIYNPRSEEAYRLLHDGILALARAERQGIRLDVKYVEKKMKSLTVKIDDLETEFRRTKFFKHWQHSMTGTINIHSGTQLSVFLYKIKKIKIEKTTVSGQGATDDEALKQMNIPELNLLLKVRKLKRIRDTYLSGFLREQVDGYIHPFFNLNLVITYRSSSDHPNFQNIPVRDKQSMRICRKALYPRPGHQLLEADFKGLEVAIATCYHKDPTMIKYVSNPKSDMHGDMAQQIFMIDKFNKEVPEYYTLRQAAKNGFVFPEFYGDYYKNCAVNLACGWGKLPQGKWSPGQGIPLPKGTLSDHLISNKIKSIDHFTEHIKGIEEHFWNVRFPKYTEWKNRWYDKYKKRGYIELLTGFMCSGVMSRNDCINYPVQGAAFHCLLWTFIRLDELIRSEKLRTRLIGQIHDSILLDVYPKERKYITEMVHKITCFELPEVWKWIIVPLDVDMSICQIDAPWSEKEKYIFK